MENKREKRAARMAGGNGNGMGGGRGSGVFGSRNQLDEVDAGIAAMQGAGGSGAALLEALESDGTPGGQPATPLAAAVQQQPTMMSKEARALMMAGLGEEGLQLWKVRRPKVAVSKVPTEGAACRVSLHPTVLLCLGCCWRGRVSDGSALGTGHAYWFDVQEVGLVGPRCSSTTIGLSTVRLTRFLAVHLQNRYYSDKMHALTAEDRRAVLEHYVAGLHWVLEYYYRGVASWDWYYPYHYAPMASDMVNLDSIQVGSGCSWPGSTYRARLAAQHWLYSVLAACLPLPAGSPRAA